MKRLLYTLLLSSILTGCTSKGEQLLATLNRQDSLGMLLSNHGQTTAYSAPGVQDLLRLTAEEPELLKGAVVADRRIGKAAAALLITGEVKEVYTPLVSTPAREMLAKAGIPVHASEEIPLMVNKDRTGLCPMESKLLDTDNPEECVAILRGESLIGRQMLQMLNEQGLSLLVYNDSVLSTHSNRGIQDLLRLITEHPERLKGAIVADKIIGKAAAALMAYGEVNEVYTNIICTPARELFEREGIRIFATQEVPMIRNRDHSGMCPIDSRITDAETVEECVTILRTQLMP